jgi:hypothetical protein
MEKTPNGRPVESAINAAIGDEVDRALKKLGAPMPRTGSNDPSEIYDALRRHGAGSLSIGAIRGTVSRHSTNFGAGTPGPARTVVCVERANRRKPSPSMQRTAGKRKYAS